MILRKNLSLLIILFALVANAKDYVPQSLTWTSQSKNSSESMPVGGHDVGMNVWVENGDVLVYISKTGFFDENNTLLKAGRMRLHIDGNPFGDADFSQTLCLDDGAVYVKGGGVTLRLWADVEESAVYSDIRSQKPVRATLSYESWRHHDRIVPAEACQQYSWKWLERGKHTTYADSVIVGDHSIVFEHRNHQQTVFDYTVSYEHLDAVKDKISDPIGGLCFGSQLIAPDFTFSGTSEGTYASTDFKAWNYVCAALKSSVVKINLKSKQFKGASMDKKGSMLFDDNDKSITRSAVMSAASVSQKRSSAWWHRYWQRSYIKTSSEEAQAMVRNYELFRYMLGCNAYGEWPTKFNGGLFTFDPVYVQTDNPFTPDFRCWGGGTMTAQNQRLVYWPMLKSGDVDMMRSQFQTYLRMLPAAMLRSQYYWNHGGACFEEQIENFGLPNPAEYGKHKEGTDYGWQNNKWLEYLYDTSLEFCQMILLANEYEGINIDMYKELIVECIRFFDEHYQQLALQRGATALDENGRLVIYPGSGCETYKMAYNPSSTVAALQCVVNTIQERHGGLASWGLDTALISRIPAMPLRHIKSSAGNLVEAIAPAETWMRIQNVETPQLYPVFPWRIYGLGRESLDIARNTYYYDDFALKMRSSKGWKQDNIWAPLLGIVDDAKALNLEKLGNGPYRFPAFWDRGFDWAPDHNRGGAAMIGLQEMLLQEGPDGELMIAPCWPKEWDAEFRMHASGGRVVDVKVERGGHFTGTVTTIENGKTIVKPLEQPLRVSIFGDSYSTFKGYLSNDKYATWYRHTDNPEIILGRNDVHRVHQTWWWQVIESLGARLERNDSYSGSTVGYLGYMDNATGKRKEAKSSSFITRVGDMGNPDLILCCAATNDSWALVPVGEYKYSNWTEEDLYTFRPAMAKMCAEMQRLYPKARILMIINSELREDITTSMHEVCDHYSIEWLDLHDIDKQKGHPSQAGMKAMAEQVLEKINIRK